MDSELSPGCAPFTLILYALRGGWFPFRLILVKYGSFARADEDDGARSLPVSLYRQRSTLLEDLDFSNRDAVSDQALHTRLSMEYALYNGRRIGRQALTTPRLVSISVQKIAGAKMSVMMDLVHGPDRARNNIGNSHVPSLVGDSKAPNALITYASRTMPATVTRDPNRKTPMTAIF